MHGHLFVLLFLYFLSITKINCQPTPTPIYKGEGCDKLKYIGIDPNNLCSSEGVFAIHQNCIDFIYCTRSKKPTANFPSSDLQTKEFDDFFTSCPPNEYFGGICMKALSEKDLTDCPQMKCNIVQQQSDESLGLEGISQLNSTQRPAEADSGAIMTTTTITPMTGMTAATTNKNMAMATNKAPSTYWEPDDNLLFITIACTCLGASLFYT